MHTYKDFYMHRYIRINANPMCCRNLKLTGRVSIAIFRNYYTCTICTYVHIYVVSIKEFEKAASFIESLSVKGSFTAIKSDLLKSRFSFVN